jgi:hypothetical protein
MLAVLMVLTPGSTETARESDEVVKLREREETSGEVALTRPKRRSAQTRAELWQQREEKDSSHPPPKKLPEVSKTFQVLLSIGTSKAKLHIWRILQPAKTTHRAGRSAVFTALPRTRGWFME